MRLNLVILNGLMHCSSFAGVSSTALTLGFVLLHDLAANAQVTSSTELAWCFLLVTNRDKIYIIKNPKYLKNSYPEYCFSSISTID